MSEDQLRATPYKPKKGGGGDMYGTADLVADLTPIREKLLAAVEINGIGPIRRDALVEAGSTTDLCIEAAKLEWKRKIEVAGFPGMIAEARARAIKAAATNWELPRMARLWREVAGVLEGDTVLSGRVSVEEIEDQDAGGRYRALRLRWREDIKDGWQAPILHVDATLDLDLVRAYFPKAELRAEIEAEVPHQMVSQYYDRTFSKAALAHDEKAVGKLWAWILAQAFQKGGRWLVVVQKAVEDMIRANFQVPAFIELAHHNAIAGRDQWKAVDHLAVVGRTQPPPQAVANIAGTLSGRHVEPLDGDGWYPATMRTLRAKDGTAVTVEADRHPDDLAENIRAAVCEGEIVQIIGRGRGVNRTAGDPLDVMVLGTVPVGQIDELRPWQGPTLDDRLVARSGVWLSSAGDMAEAYGRKRKAVEKARQRSETFSYEKLLYGNVSNLRSVTYQRKGSGRKPAKALYDLRVVPDIETWLVERLGPLAEVEVCETSMSGTEEVAEVAAYKGGIMPNELVVLTRDTIRAAGITQEAAAKQISVSRPQLANALRGRYGLSPPAADRLLAFLKRPPPLRQPLLLS